MNQSIKYTSNVTCTDCNAERQILKMTATIIIEQEEYQYVPTFQCGACGKTNYFQTSKII